MGTSIPVRPVAARGNSAIRGAGSAAAAGVALLGRGRDWFLSLARRHGCAARRQGASGQANRRRFQEILRSSFVVLLMTVRTNYTPPY